MRITLVAPPWEKMINSYPPLGLGYLASVLLTEGHSIKILDFGLCPNISINEAIAQISDTAPDLVGITTWTHTIADSISIAQGIKREIGVPVALGGPHATIFPEATLEKSAGDFVVYEEGEKTIAELVQAIEGKITFDTIQGLCYKVNGTIRKNPPRPFIHNLDEIPFPARHLMRIQDYPLQAKNGEPMTTLMTSRGCPYGCTFCYKGLFGRKYRQMSPEFIIKEINQIKTDYGIHHFYFIDDLFVFDIERLKNFLRQIREEQLDIRWHCLARVDRASRELYHQMAEAGCEEIHFGIETGNLDIMKGIKKNITLEQVKNSVKWASEAGIRTKGYFMLGLPNDTKKTIQQTINFAIKLNLDEAMFSLATPFPGTELWKQIETKAKNLDQESMYSKAFFFTGGNKEPSVFFNLSKVKDQKLIEMVTTAPQIFWRRSIRRRQIQNAYGKILGYIIWRMTALRLLRTQFFLRLGRKFFPSIYQRDRHLRSDGHVPKVSFLL